MGETGCEVPIQSVEGDEKGKDVISLKNKTDDSVSIADVDAGVGVGVGVGVADRKHIDPSSADTTLLHSKDDGMQRTANAADVPPAVPADVDEGEATVHDSDHNDVNDVNDVNNVKNQDPLQKIKTLALAMLSFASENFPTSTSGRALLVAAVASAITAHEVHLQKSLTQTPKVYGQVHSSGVITKIHQILTKTPGSILSRPMQPALFVGTRGLVSSLAAYVQPAAAPNMDHLHFRETFTMTYDNGKLGIDWEVRRRSGDAAAGSETDAELDEQLKDEIQNGPITRPVMLIMHGVNNDASFAYMKRLMQACASKGWLAGGVNFRGTGGVEMTTPRAYNASYTGDVRNIVLQMQQRLGDNVPIFLAGHSLGANIMTKYLGEEGMSGTMPKCVAGAISLGNPKKVHSGVIPFHVSAGISMGLKKLVLENVRAISKMKDQHFQSQIRRCLMALDTHEFDDHIAPIALRNAPFYPYSLRIGFKNNLRYWLDSSSYRHIRHIPVPLLTLDAEDDMICHKSTQMKMCYTLANPNVLSVETRSGGHLGWFETLQGDSPLHVKSWSDVAVVDFVDAILQLRAEGQLNGHTYADSSDQVDLGTSDRTTQPILQSKL